MTTHGDEPSPIKRLPAELRDRVCGHMASALHSALRSGSLPEDDPWIFYWTTTGRHRPPDCLIIQKRLRALSLVSKAWSRSAQRALFAVIPITSAGGLMRLLRSLILYPKNRRFIRCLIPIFSRECNEFYLGSDSAPTNIPGMVTLAHFVDNLGDILFTPIVDELPNARLLRISLIKHVRQPQIRNWDATIPFVYRFREILNFALWGVVHLSPLLSALHLRTESLHTHGPFAYGDEMTFSGRFLEISRPVFKTLSLSMEAFPMFEGWMPCFPIIGHITLLGDANLVQGHDEDVPWLDCDSLYNWLDSVVQLTSLRLLMGFDEAVCGYLPSHRITPPQHNLNSILLRHKDTLEELVFDGHRGIRRRRTLINEEEWRYLTRFGPTNKLSCLPELKNLAYLRLPLHFLMSQVHLHLINENTPPETLPSPSTAQEALALIETSFPSSLKELDIVVYGFYLDRERVGEIYPLRTITVRF